MPQIQLSAATDTCFSLVGRSLNGNSIGGYKEENEDGAAETEAEEDGVYSLSWTPKDPGVYELDVVVDGASVLGDTKRTIIVTADSSFTSRARPGASDVGDDAGRAAPMTAEERTAFLQQEELATVDVSWRYFLRRGRGGKAGVLVCSCELWWLVVFECLVCV